MIKIVPTCRYDHGPLDKVNGKFSMGEIIYEKPTGMIAQLNPDWKIMANQTGQLFITNIFQCPKCGYTELHDDHEVPEL
ncbi:hypothetical protein [Rhodoferax sp. GW822-FHT02A01]|uniref:hypothetical protein n=1 Tax=Rhodoferax sp. GW822-FHT02A01 TaxID=3141537 RepID=UPI00315DBD16